MPIFKPKWCPVRCQRDLGAQNPFLETISSDEIKEETTGGSVIGIKMIIEIWKGLFGLLGARWNENLRITICMLDFPNGLD